MHGYRDQAAFAHRPVAFADSRGRDADDRSISAVGLIAIAFVCLKGGAALAFFGGFGILMSLLIGWAASFVGLLAVVACIMLNDALNGRTRNKSAWADDPDIKMATLRASWNQNLALAQMAQHGIARGYRA
ncbi:hypothetical protein ACVDG3_15175 [Meridianimarinicoccus sp. RP-17]|uniref:hypothetical protein n=1 Tax=Meridianimarinicoccus zhengii TaxID=2056810 RepID=UPI000DAB90C3|nr:hypothetical protein [Phycocomes zhengii]